MARKKLKIPPNIPLDKTLPIPNDAHPYGYWNAVADQMVVGDSILIKSTTYHKTLQRTIGLKKALVKVKKSYVTRTQEGGIRVWCTATIDSKVQPQPEETVPAVTPLDENNKSVPPV